MLNKTTKIFISIAILLLMVLIVNAARLDYPNSNRNCYGSELAPGVPVYLCFIDGYGTDVMEASFLHYPEMHDFYTPQLKEIVVNGSSTQTLTVSPKKAVIEYGTMTITGGPSFIYTKHI